MPLINMSKKTHLPVFLSGFNYILLKCLTSASGVNVGTTSPWLQLFLIGVLCKR